jgi:hypothetical protein
MRSKPQPLPEKWCPVCDAKRADKLSVEQHNLRCASLGERIYPK